MVNEQELLEDEYIEIPETYTVVDHSVFSGFKFGVGFALGVTLVSFLLIFIPFLLFAGFINELSRTLF